MGSGGTVPRTRQTRTSSQVLLFVPNLIGYARVLALVLVAYFYFLEQHVSLAYVYVASTALDFLDGIAARALGQCSMFGEFLDVAVDSFSRTLLWVLAGSSHRLMALPAAFMASTEWSCFLSTHTGAQLARANWKHQNEADRKLPRLFQLMFANGLKNPVGAFAILGTFYCPLSLYLWLNSAFDSLSGAEATAAYGSLVFLVAGRVFALSAEWYLICGHLGALLRSDCTAEE